MWRGARLKRIVAVSMVDVGTPAPEHPSTRLAAPPAHASTPPSLLASERLTGTGMLKLRPPAQLQRGAAAQLGLYAPSSARVPSVTAGAAPRPTVTE